MNGQLKVAVAGATGRVGQHVVEILRSRGHDVVAMTRKTGVDIATGAGLAEALAGVDCIVDAASSQSAEQKAATEFFTAAARHLQRAGQRAAVGRIVVVSIIGIDRFTGGYMAAKVAHEQALLDGPVPVRILRAAQFHEFVEQIMAWGRQGDVCAVPKMRTQLASARVVAEALADLCEAPRFAAAPMTTEIAGPRPELLVSAAEKLALRRGDKVRIEAVTPELDADLYLGGGLLPGPAAKLAGPTFDEWLAASSRP